MKDNNYSYNFETLDLYFCTPQSNPVKSYEKYTKFICIILKNNTYLIGEMHKITSLYDSNMTASAAEKLWIGPLDYGFQSPLRTTRLDSGDYIVCGRYSLGQDGQVMHTKALKTIDLDHDNQMEYYVVWSGSGNVDQDLITYIASTSVIRKIIRSESDRYSLSS